MCDQSSTNPAASLYQPYRNMNTQSFSQPFTQTPPFPGISLNGVTQGQPQASGDPASAFTQSGPNFNDPGFQQFLQSYQMPQSQNMGVGSGNAMAQGDPFAGTQGAQQFQPQQMQTQPLQMSPSMSMNDPGFQNYMKGTGIDPNSAAGQAMFQSYAKTGPQQAQTAPPAQGPGDNSMGSAYYNANPPGQQKGIVLSEGPKPVASNPLSGSIPGMPWWGQTYGDTYLQGPTAGLLQPQSATGGAPPPGYQYNVQQQRWMVPPK